MGRARIQFHYDGFDTLRRSAQAEISRRAAAIAAAAGEGVDVRHDAPNRSRARAVVGTSTTEGRVRQARDDVLTRALGAGRG